MGLLTEEEGASEPGRSATLAAYAAAFGFVFLILRIFAVSGYDWDTAFLVSTTLGLDDGFALVFGSLMAGETLTAVLLVVVLPLLVAAYLWGPREHRPVVLLLAVLGLVTMTALTASTGSWWLPLSCVAVLAVLAVGRLLPLPPSLLDASRTALAKVAWVAAVGVLVLAALVSTPWVPHEVIGTSDGTVTGYVLSVDSGYLNVLTDDQEFVILLTSDVVSRR